MSSFLVIQTAFLGDVILATPIVEKLHVHFPEAEIDFLLRRGNEGLLTDHPHIRNLLIWDKSKGKYGNLMKIARTVRADRYDYVINCHRFASSGLITALSRATNRIGFDKNPFSVNYTARYPHEIGSGKHEVERNLSLIADFTDDEMVRPKLYPSLADFESVTSFQKPRYVCIAPTSVWFTKQWPQEKWVELIGRLIDRFRVFLIGGRDDHKPCDKIIDQCGDRKPVNLAGQLTLLQTAALMKGAWMNYVNDSAPLHIASAMNAPVTAVFCSTIPEFGFAPLADNSLIVQTSERLECRPCGLHGFKECPEGHFKCARGISVSNMVIR